VRASSPGERFTLGPAFSLLTLVCAHSHRLVSARRVRIARPGYDIRGANVGRTLRRSRLKDADSVTGPGAQRGERSQREPRLGKRRRWRLQFEPAMPPESRHPSLCLAEARRGG
jgi:hypothetical protein